MLWQILAARGPTDRAAMTFARRVQEIEPFLAVEVAERAQALERAGVDVVHLEFGEPDFEAPPVVAAGPRRGHQGRTDAVHAQPRHPAAARGDRRALRATYGVTVSPEQILVTPGTSPAMLLLFGAPAGSRRRGRAERSVLRLLSELHPLRRGRPGLRATITEEDGFQYRPEAIAQRLRTAHPGDPDQLAGQSRPAPSWRPTAWRPSPRRPSSRARSSCPTRSITGSPTEAATARSSSSPTAPSSSTASPRPSR